MFNVSDVGRYSRESTLIGQGALVAMGRAALSIRFVWLVS